MQLTRTDSITSGIEFTDKLMAIIQCNIKKIEIYNGSTVKTPSYVVYVLFTVNSMLCDGLHNVRVISYFVFNFVDLFHATIRNYCSLSMLQALQVLHNYIA